MRKIFVVLLFCILMSCPVFASTSDCGYTVEFSGGYMSLTLSDITFNDNSGEHKIYSYTNFTSDDNMKTKTPTLFLISDSPFSCNYTFAKNAESSVRSVSVDDNSGFACCYTSGAKFQEPTFITYSSSSPFTGLYCIQLHADSSYCNGITQFAADYSFSNSDNTTSNTKSSNDHGTYADNCFEHFFQLPPLAQPQEMTVGEVLMSFLLSGVGLAILLMAFLVLVTLLVRYLRKSLTL